MYLPTTHSFNAREAPSCGRSRKKGGEYAIQAKRLFEAPEPKHSVETPDPKRLDEAPDGTGERNGDAHMSAEARQMCMHNELQCQQLDKIRLKLTEQKSVRWTGCLPICHLWTSV